MNDNKQVRVLIVGTLPYNPRTSSRAFDAYFHNWKKENIRQIFSNAKTPVKGHCGSLFQITDHRMLERKINKNVKVGRIYNYDELPDKWENDDLDVKNPVFKLLYKIGSKDTPLKYLGRKWLWNEENWKTEELISWLDDFMPECVFLSFSDDFFIPSIAMFVAKRYDIPIMFSILDDYFFNDRQSISPFYHIYRRQYKRMISEVLKWKGRAIYISDKIRDKYNGYFGIKGDTIYLTSEVKRKEFAPFNMEEPLIVYCGNIHLGRYKSLIDIGNVLIGINSKYRLTVYSTDTDSTIIHELNRCPGIAFKGAIPYTKVQEVLSKCDITVVVEGFDEEDINLTRYSLSTKAADALASGANILAYGPIEAGVIDYLKTTGCANVCTNRTELNVVITNMMNDRGLQKRNYDKAIIISEQNHNKRRNWDFSESLFIKLVEENRR